jgi:predicted Zn-ribbon and HTH transcriptional regulator
MNTTEAIGILSGVAKTEQENDAVKTLKEALKIVDKVETTSKVIFGNKYHFKCMQCGFEWTTNDINAQQCPKECGKMEIVQ